MTLRPFEDGDGELFARWLNMPCILKRYKDPEAWLTEIGQRDGRFSFVRHFFAEHDAVPIGFCRYYDYSEGGEDWHGSRHIRDTYSIDYLIGEERYLGRHISTVMIRTLEGEIWDKTGAKCIIVQPERDNLRSRGALLSARYECDPVNDLYFRLRPK